MGRRYLLQLSYLFTLHIFSGLGTGSAIRTKARNKCKQMLLYWDIGLRCPAVQGEDAREECIARAGVRAARSLPVGDI